MPAPSVELERIEVLGADHPLPSDASAAAARRLLEIAAGAGERDIVVACFTGGSSALASLPPAGVTAAEKRDLHELLLASGIGIVEVNTVRKHVSAFKGGRLAQAALPATAREPHGLRRRRRPPRRDHRSERPRHDAGGRRRSRSFSGHGLWDDVPESIRAHLEGAAAPSRPNSPTATGSRRFCSSPGPAPATRWRSRPLSSDTPRWSSPPRSRARHARSARRSPTSPATAPDPALRSRPAPRCSAAAARAP